MKHFIFKSASGLIKNESILFASLDRKLDLVLAEQRFQRGDLKDIKLMLNKLLINEHLTQQANEYFEAESRQQRIDAGEEYQEERHEMEDK